MPSALVYQNADTANISAFCDNDWNVGLRKQSTSYRRSGFSQTRILTVFTPQNLVLDPQILGAWVLSDAYMNNPNLISFIYGFVC